MAEQVRLKVAIPIYKAQLDELEFLSIDHSLAMLSGYDSVFFHPRGLDVSYYQSRFSCAGYLPIPPEFFGSHKAYNQLCYEVNFYRKFEDYTHLLILQPDAVVLRPELLDEWCRGEWDYVGGPETHQYKYDIKGLPPFSQLNAWHPVLLQGLNGGLSLRRISSMVAALEEYPELTQLFRSHAGGIGEDIFFSLMGRVSKTMRVPNEMVASRFALTGDFDAWIKLNGGELPFGFHAWYRSMEDRDYILSILGKELV